MIETKRLLIRSFNKNDWRDLYEYLSDEEVVKFEPYECYTLDECKKEAARRSKDGDFKAVCLKDTLKLIGNIYLSERDFNTWELGYVFNKNFQGYGYATEAASVMVDDAFKNRGARRIIAMCSPLNVSSWRLLERLGMRREGHLLQNIYFKLDKQGNPIWHDTYEYGILAAEWHSNPLPTPIP